MADNYSVAYIFEAIDKMSQNLNTIKKNVKGLDGAFSGAGNKAKTFSQKTSMASSKIRSFGNNMRYASLAATAIGVASVRNFAKMERGILNVQGLMEKDEITKYTGKLNSLQLQAVKTGFTIDDSNKGLFDTVSALGSGNQAFNAYEQAQKLAIGGNAELSTSLDGITSVVNAYGRETTKASDVANAFYSAQIFGKTTVSELANNVGKVAPIAKVAGVGFEELLSTMSAVTLGGLSTDEATTALRGALSALSKPGTQARKILEKLGIAHGRTQIKAVGLRKVLEQVIVANKKYPDALDLAIPNIRAFTGLMTLSSDKLDIIDRSMRKIAKDTIENTGLQDAYNRNLKSTDQQLKMLRGSFSAISKLLGEDLAPYVEMINNKTKELSKTLEDIDPDIRKLITGFGAIVAISTPVALVLSYIVKILGSTVLLTAGKSVLIIAGAFMYVYWVIQRVNDLMNNFAIGFYKIMRDVGFLLKSLPIGGFKVIGQAMYEGGRSLVKSRERDKLIRNRDFWKKEQSDINYTPVNQGKSDVNIYFHDPGKMIKNYSSTNEGLPFNLGFNMGQ